MRAVRLHGFGGVDQLRLDDVPVPTPGPGEVRIKVGAAAVNQIDWKIRSGSYPLNATLPFTLGCEAAGTIDALGSGVTQYEIGQRVWAFADIARSGLYAEYATLPLANVSFAPPRLDDAQAAALPVAAVTATQALAKAEVRPGQRVLILGGAGSVGSIVIQAVRHMSGWPIATASGRNQDFLREIGAAEALNYEEATLETAAPDIDVVFDTVGGQAALAAYACLKEGGRFVSIVQPPDAVKLAARKATGFMHVTRPSSIELLQAASQADLEILRPNVAEIMRLSDFARAHAMSESGHVRGKLILIP